MNLLDLVLSLVDELELNDYFYNFKIDNDMTSLGSYNKYKKLLKLNLDKINKEYENNNFGIKFILFHEIAHIEQIKTIDETNHYMNNILKDCMKKNTEKELNDYYKYHDYYIHEHHATMRSFMLLIEKSESKEELDYIVKKLKEYLEDIYKQKSPLEKIEEIKNTKYSIVENISNDDKVMYGLKDSNINEFVKKYTIDNK